MTFDLIEQGEQKRYIIKISLEGLEKLKRDGRLESAASDAILTKSSGATNSCLEYEKKRDKVIFGANFSTIDCLDEGDEKYFDIYGKPLYTAVILVRN